ncbi:T-lymphocyte surface antigen Ly-9-like isoform X2 [Channa argus]|uniref:T-lymphocyte surface antigen Ly-9-like isoform X2 n=1 Tax=Channa argus TaxID=215402 RepID=UPI0035229782
MLNFVILPKGSSAVSPVFVLQGKDVLLNVNQNIKLKRGTDFNWRFNTTYRIVKCNNAEGVIISERYQERAEFYKANYSLLLKNLQHNDSGQYAAVLSGETDETVTKQEVTVEDPVSPVTLTVISSSSDPCNITVTCSTVDSLITKTYRCDKQTCSYQGGEEATANYNSINVIVQEGFIICNHSNHVSWKNDTMDIKTYCGSKSESLSDAVSHVFVLKGNDLLLNVQNPTFELNEETEFQWKFNTKIRIAKLTNEKKDTIFDPYKGRAELFKENYSLLLKNLQQSDSGDYAAVLSEGTETTITEHKVTVEEPVSPVKLTVISSSSDPCNITVTCSTVDSLITKTYRCDKQTCSYQGGEEATANYDSINVTVQEGFIICNHSNHVSWKNDTMDIKTYCGSKSESVSDAVSHVFVLKGNDLLLNVNQTFELNEETEFQWKFNTKIRIAKLTNEKKDTIFDPYKGRAELFKENYSLLLKNLQQSDSGDYAAVLSEGTETTITEHKVTVEEPVSPVKLTVISSSSDPCNITVTCSTVDSLITKTYRCDKQTCSYQGGEEATANYDSINVTVQEGFIICNHSNHVSWKNDTMDIKTYCGSKSDNAAGLSLSAW